MDAGETVFAKRGTKIATLKMCDVTLDNIARLFKVVPSSMYLTNEDGVSVFPIGSGGFSCLDLVCGQTYQVNGDDALTPNPSRDPTTSGLSAPGHSTPGQSQPRFSFIRTSRVSTPIPVKMYQRSISVGQLQGDRLIQDKSLIIPFTEAEATVEGMTMKVREALGSGDITLTDSQGSVLIDSPGTKGSTYWKQSTRKIFAVGNDLLDDMKRKRRKMGPSSRREEAGLAELSEKIEILHAAEGLPTVAAKLQEICRQSEGLTKEQAVLLRASFTCGVCRGVMESPMLARCCRSLIGCQQCVAVLIAHGDACIKCRGDLREETVVAVAGLSEALGVIRSLE